MDKKFFSTKNMAIMAMLAAISVVLYTFVEIPIIPSQPHLKVNFADIPALIAGLVISPMAAIVVLGIRCVLHLFKTDTVGIGEAIDFFIGCGMMLTFLFSYRKLVMKINQAASFAVATALAVIATIISGWATNLVFYPLYMHLVLGLQIESAAVFVTYLLGTVITNVVRSVANILPLAFMLPLITTLKKRFA